MYNKMRWDNDPSENRFEEVSIKFCFKSFNKILVNLKIN